MPQQLPAAVYWRRRLLVVAVLIALVWVALQLLPDGDDDPSPKATPTATQAPVEATVPDGPVQVRLTSAGDACDPQQVRVTPTVRPKQKNRGEVEIGLVMSTASEKPCTLSPGDADLIAIISANDKAVWDSTVCKQSLLTEPVELTARWATLVLTTWSGKGSGSTCSAKEGWASAGDYVVQAGTLGGEPGKTTFTLDARPEPKKNETPKSDETEKPKAKDTTKPND